ncbi:hypothetical protein B0H16DRAFT_1485482 [Mycena metata]|uniref:Uncharacterized protein n=1 Tax=Mycena metata TaxID=1033252 RepID=A0AAD7DPB3_9AGAR|nr:hypothetical protein B0H16DRAFT_1485482 [Mycena metata]
MRGRVTQHGPSSNAAAARGSWGGREICADDIEFLAEFNRVSGIELGRKEKCYSDRPVKEGKVGPDLMKKPGWPEKSQGHVKQPATARHGFGKRLHLSTVCPRRRRRDYKPSSRRRAGRETKGGRKQTAPGTNLGPVFGNPICNPNKSDERTLSVLDNGDTRKGSSVDKGDAPMGSTVDKGAARPDKGDVRIGSGVDKGDALMGSTVDKGAARVGSVYRQRQRQRGMIHRQRQRASGAKTGSRPCAVELRTSSQPDKGDVRVDSGPDKGDVRMGSTVNKGGVRDRQRRCTDTVARRQRPRASGVMRSWPVATCGGCDWRRAGRCVTPDA